MIIMTPTKLFYPLKCKQPNSKEMLLGFVLTAIGIVWLFKQYQYEIAYANSFKFESVIRIAYKTYNPEWNYLNGLWTIPLCLGIILFLDSLDMIPDITFKKIKKEFKKIRL